MKPTRAESWLPVVGYEGLYEVSDLGRVRSLDRVGVDKIGRSHFYQGRILLPGWRTRYRYPCVKLQRAGHVATRSIHTLVLEAFVGPCPPGMECLHGPGGPADNRWPEAIRWGTKNDNQGPDRVRDGTSNRGERSNRAKLTEAAVRACRQRYAQGEPVGDLAAEFGVSDSAMNHAIIGLTWSHLPDDVFRSGPARGNRNGQAKLTEAIVRECRRRYTAGETQAALAAEFSVTEGAVGHAVTGRTWRHVS